MMMVFSSVYEVYLSSCSSWPPSLASRSACSFPWIPDRAIVLTKKLASQWLPCQAPGIIGSVLGMVGPVSVYFGWVR